MSSINECEQLCNTTAWHGNASFFISDSDLDLFNLF